MQESMHICFRNLDNCQMCEKKNTWKIVNLGLDLMGVMGEKNPLCWHVFHPTDDDHGVQDSEGLP